MFTSFTNLLTKMVFWILGNVVFKADLLLNVQNLELAIQNITCLHMRMKTRKKSFPAFTNTRI